MTTSASPGPAAGPGAGKLDAAADAIVRLDRVSYEVSGRTILDDISLDIARGKVTAIMGPSGTGKTTLLRLITGQLMPTRGTLTVAGVDLSRLADAELYEFRKRMGMLFQNGALLTDIDVYENVAFPLREHTALPEELIARIVLMKLQSVGLRGAARLMPAELSGGMARRVALARAIVMDPELLIYDEPFAGLDPIAMGVVLRLIRQTNDALGITSIVVSHDVHEVGLLADVTLLLSGGRIAAVGPPSELQKHASDAVRQFMNGLPDGPVPFHYPAPDYDTQLLAGEVPA
jgi:phospholipid/cholesterol/gamma-HCH transport system ATP-binding protein